MTRRDFLATLPAAAMAQRPASPNFILIVIDDWGWTDAGCYGSKFYETPNIDKLASQGMRFTQAYSACTVCSPSRAAIMTGKYPARLHVTDWIPGHKFPKAKLAPPAWTQYLPLEETTIAESLKTAGYATASIGKWHLGGEEFFPEKQGFDRNLGGTHAGQPPSYFSPYRIKTLSDGPEREYLTDREAEEAAKFLKENAKRPFFLYLPHHAVHTPLQAKQELIEKYRKKAGGAKAQGDPVYAAMVESMDQSIGRIMRTLDELQLTGNTVVLLTSDNGGLLRSTANAPLRVGKGSAYEGGVRVPFIVRWPGTVQAGSTCDVPVCGIDVHPTFAEIARSVSRKAIDGVSLMPLLKGGRELRRDTLYWHYPHYHNGGATPYSAVRERDLRLIHFYEDDRLELYDLKADISESNDLSASRPKDVKRLKAKLESWRKEVKAQDPIANPAFAAAN